MEMYTGMKNKFTQIGQKHGNKNVTKFKKGQNVTRYGNVDWSEELFMATTHPGTATFWSINCYVVVCTS